MFGDSCPGTPKYVEVHYQCVQGHEASTQKYPVPPWFFELTATLANEHNKVEVMTESSHEMTTIDMDLKDVSLLNSSESNQASSTKPPQKDRRYYLINDQEPAKESEERESTVILIVAVTISTLSTVVCFIIVHQI